MLLWEPLGGVAERFKAHAWNACWGQPLAGSNPVSSAYDIRSGSDSFRAFCH
jgi:hypothetical protein